MAAGSAAQHPGLNKRAALVTGGARGLGRAIAEALVEAGASVAVIDAQMPEDADLAIDWHIADIRDAKAIAQTVQSLPAPPSLLVNNAGVTRDRTIAKMSDAEWNEVLDTNLSGAFNMIRACAPAMTTGGYGRIVNIVSINGLRGKFGQANYSASKAGLIGLTKAAARELGRKGVTVNAVAPGLVMTDMARNLPREILDQALNETVTGALAEPGDVAAAVLFLLSSAARCITGQVLQVDSGQYI